MDEAGAVFQCRLGIVERAWPADYEEPVVVLLEDVDGFFAAFEDGGDGVFGCWVLGGEELRCYKWCIAENLKGC